MNASFTLPCPGWIPPNRTALCGSMAVKEKSEQGGGLSPVVGGDDQIPANDIMMSSQGSMEHSSAHYNLFVHTCTWRL